MWLVVLSPRVTLTFAGTVLSFNFFISNPFSGTHEIVAPVSTITGKISPQNSKNAVRMHDCEFIDPATNCLDDIGADISLNAADNVSSNACLGNSGMDSEVRQTYQRTLYSHKLHSSPTVLLDYHRNME